VAIAIACGDGLGNFRIFAPQWLAWMTALAGVVAMAARWVRTGYFLALVAIVLFATLLVRSLLLPDWAGGTIRTLPENATACIEGVLSEEPEHLPDRTHLVVRVARAGASCDSLAPATGNVRITALAPVDYLVGDELSVSGRIRFPRNNGNPGEYDYQGAMARAGITATVTLSPKQLEDGSLRLLAHHSHFPFSQLQRIRNRIAGFINRNLPETEAGEMRALVIGDRSGINDEVREAFARTGMAHLLVISGLHLGFVAAAVFGALRFATIMIMPGFASRGWANKVAAIGAAAAVCGYTAIAGHHVSTMRAMVMVLAYMTAIVLDRASEAVASLALAVIVICLAMPGSTADIGFQLSFASVLAIVLGMRRYAAWIKMRERRGRLPREEPSPLWRFAERPAGYVAVSFWATLGTAPLTAFHFNQIEMVGLVANAVVVPIMGFGATLAGLAAVISGAMWEDAGAFFLWLASHALAVSNLLARWFQEWPAAWTRCFTPTLAEMALAYGALWLWLDAPLARIATPSGAPREGGEKWRWRAAAALAAIAAVDAGWWCYARFFDHDLRVAFLAVGEGDAAVVRFPGGRVMLVDGGGAYGGYDAGERIVAPYLWSQKVMHVDYVVMSHPDSDHFGGLTFIAENFSPDEYWTSGGSSSDETYAAMLIAMIRAGVRLRKIDGAAFEGSVGDVSIQAFAENPPGRAKRNNSSLVLRLAFGRTAFLFTGDIEAPAERALLAEGISLGATVLKVPHHGSKSSSTPEFVEAVRPAVAVISDGYMNRFHFPAPAVVERYRSAGAAVLRTDLDGAIITRATRQEVEVRAFRGGGFLVRQEGLR